MILNNSDKDLINEKYQDRLKKFKNGKWVKNYKVFNTENCEFEIKNNFKFLR